MIRYFNHKNLGYFISRCWIGIFDFIQISSFLVWSMRLNSLKDKTKNNYGNYSIMTRIISSNNKSYPSSVQWKIANLGDFFFWKGLIYSIYPIGRDSRTRANKNEINNGLPKYVLYVFYWLFRNCVSSVGLTVWL